MSSSPPSDIRKLSLAAIAFLIILRVSIGWQFFYEGMWKYHSLSGKDPWSAAGYLKNAKGPFRNTFRNMVDDPYEFDKLDLSKTTARWNEWKESFKTYYGLDDEQSKKLDAIVKTHADNLKSALENPDWVGKPADQKIGEFEVYRGLVERYEGKLKFAKVNFQQDHLDKEWADIEKKRKDLTAPANELTDSLELAAPNLLTAEQNAKGRMPVSEGKITDINQKTIWALTILGFCMMVGLFSRVAAIGTGVMLMMFYLVIPPWPGVPEAPGPEHSLIVNKNLIEFIACLALASMPTGRWLGIDAFIHRFILRGKTD